jgi:hypothetical protein
MITVGPRTWKTRVYRVSAWCKIDREQETDRFGWKLKHCVSQSPPHHLQNWNSTYEYVVLHEASEVRLCWASGPIYHG